MPDTEIDYKPKVFDDAVFCVDSFESCRFLNTPFCHCILFDVYLSKTDPWKPAKLPECKKYYQEAKSEFDQAEAAKKVLEEFQGMTKEELRNKVESAPKSWLSEATMMMDPEYYGRVTGINDNPEEDHM